MSSEPKLLVDWEPAWRSLLTSFVVLFSSGSAKRLPSVPTGIRWRSPLASIFFHFAVLFAWMNLSPFITAPFPGFRQEIEVHPEIPRSQYQIVYVRGDLPSISGITGAESGRKGRSGGNEFFHPKQVIRIAAGRKLVDRIVEAGEVRLPRTDRMPANLIALANALPAPPARAASNTLHSFRTEVVPPAPDIATSSRNRLPGVETPVVPPPPKVEPGVSKARLPMLAAQPAAPPENEVSPAQHLENKPVAGMQTATSGGGADQANAHAAPGGTGTVASGLTGGTDGAGVLIISVNPGDQIGLSAMNVGSLAMSPEGGRGGFGGNGGGTGVGHGTGTGNARSGNGPGAGESGTGLGADPAAKGGTSPLPGPGGAGVGVRGPTIPGVVISGGTVNLPSFGTGTASVPPTKGTSRRGLSGVIVIASPRAGGGLNDYGSLKGGRVYTMYIETHGGTTILQYADPSARAGFEMDLQPPDPVSTDLPAELRPVQTVVACILDRLGSFRDLKIVRTASPELSAQLLNVLKKWRLRPVFRGNEAIEVNAMLGFGVDTR